jgi:hypothetical protein
VTDRRLRARPGPHSALGRGIYLVSAVALLFLSIALPASADLLREPVRTVTSALPNPASLPNAVPEPPPIPSPPVQVKTAPAPSVDLPSVKPPAVPKAPAPAAPKPPVELHAPDTPTEATSAASKSADGVIDSAPSSAGAVTGASARSDRDVDAAGHATASRAGVPGGVSPSTRPRSVGPTRQAPLRHWLAHVWPAVALGPFEDLLPALAAGFEDAASPGILAAPRLLSQLAADIGAGGVAGLDERSVVARSQPADPPQVSLPVGGEISLLVLLLASAILTALLVFAVRQELGPMHRWPQ